LIRYDTDAIRYLTATILHFWSLFIPGDDLPFDFIHSTWFLLRWPFPLPTDSTGTLFTTTTAFLTFHHWLPVCWPWYSDTWWLHSLHLSRYSRFWHSFPDRCIVHGILLRCVLLFIHVCSIAYDFTTDSTFTCYIWFHHSTIRYYRHSTVTLFSLFYYVFDRPIYHLPRYHSLIPIHHIRDRCKKIRYHDHHVPHTIRWSIWSIRLFIPTYTVIRLPFIRHGGRYTLLLFPTLQVMPRCSRYSTFTFHSHYNYVTNFVYRLMPFWNHLFTITHHSWVHCSIVGSHTRYDHSGTIPTFIPITFCDPAIPDLLFYSTCSLHFVVTTTTDGVRCCWSLLLFDTTIRFPMRVTFWSLHYVTITDFICWYVTFTGDAVILTYLRSWCYVTWFDEYTRLLFCSRALHCCSGTYSILPCLHSFEFDSVLRCSVFSLITFIPCSTLIFLPCWWHSFTGDHSDLFIPHSLLFVPFTIPTLLLLFCSFVAIFTISRYIRFCCSTYCWPVITVLFDLFIPHLHLPRCLHFYTVHYHHSFSHILIPRLFRYVIPHSFHSYDTEHSLLMIYRWYHSTILPVFDTHRLHWYFRYIRCHSRPYRWKFPTDRCSSLLPRWYLLLFTLPFGADLSVVTYHFIPVHLRCDPHLQISVGDDICGGRYHHNFCPLPFCCLMFWAHCSRYGCYRLHFDATFWFICCIPDLTFILIPTPDHSTFPTVFPFVPHSSTFWYGIYSPPFDTVIDTGDHSTWWWFVRYSCCSHYGIRYRYVWYCCDSIPVVFVIPFDTVDRYDRPDTIHWCYDRYGIHCSTIYSVTAVLHLLLLVFFWFTFLFTFQCCYSHSWPMIRYHNSYHLHSMIRRCYIDTFIYSYIHLPLYSPRYSEFDTVPHILLLSLRSTLLFIPIVLTLRCDTITPDDTTLLLWSLRWSICGIPYGIRAIHLTISTLFGDSFVPLIHLPRYPILRWFGVHCSVIRYIPGDDDDTWYTTTFPAVTILQSLPLFWWYVLFCLFPILHSFLPIHLLFDTITYRYVGIYLHHSSLLFADFIHLHFTTGTTPITFDTFYHYHTVVHVCSHSCPCILVEVIFLMNCSTFIYLHSYHVFWWSCFICSIYHSLFIYRWHFWCCCIHYRYSVLFIRVVPFLFDYYV